jgi:hypothetical protein
MASMADNRWVGVYSRRAEMRSMASGGALRKTWVGSALTAVFPASEHATEEKRRDSHGHTLLKGWGLI